MDICWIRDGIKPGDSFRRCSEILRDRVNFGRIDGYHRGTAAIRACGTVYLPLDFASRNLERRVTGVLGRQIAAEGKILYGLCGSDAKYLRQIGNHFLTILPGGHDCNGSTGAPHLAGRLSGHLMRGGLPRRCTVRSPNPKSISESRAAGAVQRNRQSSQSRAKSARIRSMRGIKMAKAPVSDWLLCMLRQNPAKS